MSTGRGTIYGQSRFSVIPTVQMQRSKFKRSCGHKTTFNAGLLVPIFVDEVLPGDTMSMRMAHFGRLATPLHPVFENLYLDFFFFYVPNRLLWENWKRFMGESDAPEDDPTTYSIPQIPAPAGGWPEGSQADHFGIPTKVANISVSALPFRAMGQIYNEWFRPQDFLAKLQQSVGDGPDTPAFAQNLFTRAKRHDYFTSCLPWPQKGPAISIPITGSGSITGVAPVQSAGDGIPLFNVPTSGAAVPSALAAQSGVGQPNVRALESVSGEDETKGLTWSNPKLEADMTGTTINITDATAAKINDLREAFQLQRLLERDARGGTRYTEIIRAHFNVTSPDARQQRPEYLGGGTHTININPVAQTSETTQNSPQANLAAIGTTAASGSSWSKSFTEHGWIIGLASMRADLTYQQGIERMWSRRGKYEFYWPTLAHLGEQEVLSKEIYADGTADDDQVFGYQERYAEYRYKPSRVTGKFRSNATQPLDTWHLAQNFSSRPNLNIEFLTEKPPVDRILAVQSAEQPNLILDLFFDYTCIRPMPMYSVPGMIDHF